MDTALKPYRKRQCKLKVRSGCLTCKIRRVKCDEGKPTCNRCTSTGRKCDGYAPKPSAMELDDGPTMILQNLSLRLSGTTAEKRGFNYFLVNTASELSGYFTTDFWGRLVLQASAAEPSLQHAVIAIGSLHEGFTKDNAIQAAHNSGFAGKQYAKAIGYLRKSLASGKNTLLTTLMSCVLFVCFDSIRGAFSAAMIHIKSGLRIMGELRSSPKLSSEDRHLIEHTIAPLFMNTALQAILYVDTRDTPDRRAFSFEMSQANESDVQIPIAFKTLDEARYSMNQATEGLFRTFFMYDGELPLCYQPAEALALHLRYAERLRQWKKSFEKFMVTYSKYLSSKELRGAALLKIQHTCVTIMADSTPLDMEDPRPLELVSNSPDSFLRLENDFRMIVDLSRSLISAAELDAKEGRSSLRFSAEMGVVAPLFYVAQHCTNREVGQAAIKLLEHCPRREGMWDSAMAIKIVKQLWDIEDCYAPSQSNPLDAKSTHKLVDLEVHDGTNWEWKWKE
ncbi:hypothetical protein B0O99DRAFT_622188 [Bisporella sp. PMI_857]|nr:hypothetical protein B0O99DRAFT_622188 [Bisporella sp. PMI_857]